MISTVNQNCIKFMRQATHFAVACGHFLCHSNKLAKCCHWQTHKQCGTCLLCLRFLSLPSGHPIFKSKSSSASITSLRFAHGGGWTGEQKYTGNECWYGNLQDKEHRAHIKQSVNSVWHALKALRTVTKKGSQTLGFQLHFELRGGMGGEGLGEGGRGSRGDPTQSE